VHSDGPSANKVLAMDPTAQPDQAAASNQVLFPWFALVAAVAVVMVGLYGCGGSGDNATSSGNPATNTTNATNVANPASSASPPPPTAATTGSSGAATKYADVRGADLGVGASLNGAIIFPSDNAWNTDISAAAVDPNSANLIASMGLARGLHPDFGAGLYAGSAIGIPYVVVSGAQAKVAINFTAYGAESDPGPYPIPGDAPIEGEQARVADTGGDRHVIVVDRDNNRLYELFRAFKNGDGSWNADSGAVFQLTSNQVRPTAQPGWTSADAAGLPIFPGLVRYDEVAAGAIRHALRFTAASTRKAYLPPATHWASSSTNANLPPMGLRVRLKSSYVIPASFTAETRVILQAMKTYGMILADNGSNWYVSGAPDSRWNNDRLVSELAAVKGSDFEVVQMTGLVTN
jgi:hypothetical protein